LITVFGRIDDKGKKVYATVKCIGLDNLNIAMKSIEKLFKIDTIKVRSPKF